MHLCDIVTWINKIAIVRCNHIMSFFLFYCLLSGSPLSTMEDKRVDIEELNRPIMTLGMVAFQLHSPGTIAINSTVYSLNPLLMLFHMNVYFSCFIQTSGAVVRVSLCIISLRKCKQGQNLLIIQQWKAERISTDNIWLYVKAKHFNHSKTV